MTRFAFAQAAEHAAAVARAIDGENARAGPVFISGATGDRAEAINGFFAPTQEKGLDGRFVLSKRGDTSVCLEHFGGRWQVKSVSSKGKGAGMAFIAGGCALEDCTSRVWKVDDGIPEHPLLDQPSVKMVTGREAELQVSGGRIRAGLLHPCPCTSQSCFLAILYPPASHVYVCPDS